MSKVMRTHTGITEWNGDYWCDSCKRRIPQVRTVDGMDFCPKCYQETFGETDKDKKIADLEAKLAEKDEKLLQKEREIEDLKLCEFVATTLDFNKLSADNCRLREQLAESEKERIYLRSYGCEYVKEIKELKQQLAEKEKELEEINREFVQSTHDWKEIVDEKIKAKTEFAIQQLQRVKEEIDKSGYKFLEPMWVQFVVIDQIIKELEEKDAKE